MNRQTHINQGYPRPSETAKRPDVLSYGDSSQRNMLSGSSPNALARRVKDLENDLDDFLYNCSHALKAPISTTLGILELISNTTSPEEEKLYLSLIREAQYRQLYILRKAACLLNKNANLAPIASSSILDMAKELIKNRGVSSLHIKNHLSEPISVIIDIESIKTVLNEIIDNSIRFKRESESLILTLSASETKGFYYLSLADNGIGISPDFIKNVKKAFFKANTTHQGEGLGLYIANTILRRQNGFLKIRSDLDVGTTVTIVLPKL